MSRTVLVTGAAGFIGAALCIRLLQQGDRVVGLDNLNNYYDPSLKKARLLEIESSAPVGAWRFDLVDLQDGDAVLAVFAEEQPQPPRVPADCWRGQLSRGWGVGAGGGKQPLVTGSRGAARESASVISRESPKSPILKVLSCVMNTLLGVRSRCMSDAWWMCASPCRTCTKQPRFTPMLPSRPGVCIHSRNVFSQSCI